MDMENVSLGLRTAIYRVKDIDAAKQWYARAFNTQPYFDEPFYVGFDIGGFELGLQPEIGAPESKAESVVAFWGVTNLRERTYTSPTWEQPRMKSPERWVATSSWLRSGIPGAISSG